MSNDDLTLTVGGNTISGWDDVRVTVGVERCPNDFAISLTERYPGEADELVIQQGDACQVSIGGDLVITGFVDRYVPEITRDSHAVRITGRGKCQDLVDCAAEWPNGQISGSSALEIAQKLAEPYGISVNTDADVGDAIPQFNLILGETAYEIIERICRYRGLLVYEQPDGSLFLTQVGTAEAASGFSEGANVERASASYSMDRRFSEYQALLQSMEAISDAGDGGNLLATVTDPGVKRHRRMIIITEAGGGGQDVAKQRALWEAARRAGRSNVVSLTADSWRDSAGKLWKPNTLAPLALPSLKLAQAKWIIGEVGFVRSNGGTTAEVTLMPPAAFLPQPVLLQPFPADVVAGGAT